MLISADWPDIVSISTGPAIIDISTVVFGAS
jgi:hypothetical protein